MPNDNNMDWGLASGLNAINDTYSRRDSKDRAMGMMDKIEATKLMREQKDIQGQEKVQKEMDIINEYSGSLLVNDQQAVQKQAIEMQDLIQKEIRKAGGDVQRFLANGGTKMMSEYKNRVLYSESSMKYKANKENMNKIISAQDSGLGGRLTFRDRSNLESYHKNGGGELSYSGLLSEIKMPASNAYNVGTQIPAGDILMHDNNYALIASNYMMDYPDANQPTKVDLLEYVKTRYAKPGTKTPSSTSAGGRTKSQIANEKKGSSDYVVNSQAQLLGFNNGQQIPADMLRHENIDELFNGNKNKGLIGKEFNRVGATDTGWFDGRFDGRSKSLKGSHYLYGGSGTVTTGVTKSLLGDSYNAETGVAVVNTLDMFNSDGVIETESRTANSKPVGIVMGYKGLSAKEGEYLAMNAVDSDGNIDPSRQKDIDDGLEGNLMATQLIAFESEDGEMFYKELDPNDPIVAGYLRESMGSLNNLDTYTGQKRTKQGEIQSDKYQTAVATKANKVALNDISRTPAFYNHINKIHDSYGIRRSSSEVNALAIALGSGGQLNTSHQAATDGARILSSLLNEEGDGTLIREVLQDNTINFDTMISRIEKIMTADGTPLAEVRQELQVARNVYKSLTS